MLRNPFRRHPEPGVVYVRLAYSRLRFMYRLIPIRHGDNYVYYYFSAKFYRHIISESVESLEWRETYRFKYVTLTRTQI